jgi:glycosyltransferase involved in cell wall biosynthesis
VHKYVQQKVIDYCDYVIAHDNAAKIALLKTFEIDQHKLFVAPHGLYKIETAKQTTDTLKENLNLPADSFVILILGRIRQYKGIDQALLAFNEIYKCLNRRAYLVIAGAPDDKILDGFITDHAKRNSHIRYINREMSQEEVDNLYRIASLSWLPYEAGMTSGVAYMSISHKVPMLVSKLPFLTDFIDHGLAIGADKADMSYAIDYLCKEKSLKNTFPGYQNDSYFMYLEWESIIKMMPYSTLAISGTRGQLIQHALQVLAGNNEGVRV